MHPGTRISPEVVPADAESAEAKREMPVPHGRAPRVQPYSPPKPDVEPRNIRYGVTVAGTHLLSAPETLNELVGSAEIHPLPRVPQWVLGLINLRGHLVPVFDLASLIAPEAPAVARRRLLVIDKGESAAAITLDGFPQALNFDLASPQRRATMPETLSTHTRAAYLIDDTEWLEIDFGGLFQSLSAQLA